MRVVTLSAIVTPALALPTAALAMVGAATHLVVVERTTGDALRRRIRIANGWVMLLAIPLIAAGFSVIDPSRKPRMFLLVWLVIIGLVALSIALALADILNTSASARRAVRNLRRTRSRLLNDAERAADRTRRTGHEEG